MEITLHNLQRHVTKDQRRSIQDVLEYSNVLKNKMPGINLTQILTDHIISIVEDYDPETIYDEMKENRSEWDIIREESNEDR